MVDFERIADLRSHLSSWRRGGCSIGFVPTMGALHIGHISLINKAKSECDRVVCSIFVNPSQFNDPADLEHYPRTPGPDRELLETAGCDALFMPGIAEMYPDNRLLELDFGLMEAVMEGAYRPGHFKGVATVVSKFFSILEPDSAYFGEKDFQQLAVIRELARRMHPHVRVVGCETIRESDGLAFSSRNIHLSAEERKHAGVIYHTLVHLGAALRHQERMTAAVSSAVAAIESMPAFKVQYLQVVDSETLQPAERYNPDRSQRICIAVLTSRTRLIDNIAV